jgi:MFS transporter, DHA1 family, multidrug resistance protein
MYGLIRDAPFGQLVRYFTRNRVFRYPEEEPGWHCPTFYPRANDGTLEQRSIQEYDAINATSEQISTPDIASEQKEASLPLPVDIEKAESSDTDDSSSDEIKRVATASSHIQRTATLAWTEERLEADRQLAVERTKTKPVVPTTTADGIILVDW